MKVESDYITTPPGYVAVLYFVIGTGLDGANERIYSGCSFSNPIIYPLSHILVVRRGDQIFTYWDNQIKGILNITQLYRPSFNIDAPIRISAEYKSNIVSCRIYDRALTDDEIQQNYQAEVQRQNVLEKANLAELTVTPGVISPAFKASTLNYTVLMADRAVESVNITATPLSADATVTIDGEVLGTGTQSKAIDVLAGPQEVPIVVMEADGITTKTYRIRIVKPGCLTGLSVDGTPVSGFASETFDYTVDVAYAVSTVNVAAILEAPSTQSLSINNQPFSSGQAVPVSLAVGNNIIPIKVVVLGHETTYTLNIRRAAATADLLAITSDQGILSPAFQADITDYTITLDQPLTSIELTATPADSNAAVSLLQPVGDAPAQTGARTITVPLQAGNNEITLMVQGADGGVTTKTYNIELKRPAGLTGLILDQGTLTPAFDRHTQTYTANVVTKNDRPTSLHVTASVEEGAELYINGDLQTSGAEKEIALEVGMNEITIETVIAGLCYTYNLNVTCTVVKGPKSKSKEDEKKAVPESSGPGKIIIQLTVGQNTVKVNNENKQLDAMPIIDARAGRTLVPLRFIGEALGTEVEWVAVTRQIVLKDAENEIVLWIDSPYASVNGQMVQMDCPPQIIINGRTFVPVRFISEVLNATVDWNEETQEIKITRW